MSGVDQEIELAAFIREIDGNHDMGTCKLAERILEWQAARKQAVPSGYVMVPSELVKMLKHGLARCRHYEHTDFALKADEVTRLFEAAPQAEQAAEPVAVMYADGTVLSKADCGSVFDICCRVETPLYTAPPAPDVSGLVEALELLEVMQQQINGLLQYAGATDGYDEYAEQIAALATHRSSSHDK